MIKEKIFYLFLEPFRFGHGGHTHAEQIIKNLSQYFEIVLFSPKYDKDKVLPKFWGRLLKILKTQFDCFLKSKEIKLIYVRAHFLALPFIFLARCGRKKIVLEVNGPVEDSLVHWKKFSLLKFFLKLFFFMQIKLSHSIIVVTPQLKKYILCNVRVFEKNIFVISNAADHNLYHPNAKSTFLFQNKYVIFFGSLVKWQGLDFLLEATNHPSWPYDVDLVIAGYGPMRKLVEERAKVFPRIHYLGLLAQEQLPGLISNSICSVIPKQNLGYYHLTGLAPVKLYESLACGVPVVVTNIVNISDIVRQHKIGIVVQEDSPESISEAVRELHSNVNLRTSMQKNARDYILKGNTWEYRAFQTYQLIENLLN